MRFTHTRAQAGDTIVEVMIAIAIISSVLVGAFLVSSTSTRSVQDTGERAQALQLAQSQVEMIRSYVADGGTFAGSSPYCMVSQSGQYTYKTSVGDANNCDPADNASRGAQFRPSFTKNGPNYTVTVGWEGLKSAANIQLTYRIYGVADVL